MVKVPEDITTHLQQSTQLKLADFSFKETFKHCESGVSLKPECMLSMCAVHHNWGHSKNAI